MSDFRLKVFVAVAKTLNFNRAAEQLNISQPAVTRHIRELEEQYNLTFFDRTSRRTNLTAAGAVLLEHAHRILEQYDKLDFDLNLLQNKTEGTLHIGASTTIAQYILPVFLARFHQRFPDVQIELINANSQEIETMLAEKRIELGLVEGPEHRADLKYTHFLQDELVLVARARNNELRNQTVTARELKTLPLVVRETGSGTTEIIEQYLETMGIKLKDLPVEMQLGSTESIKSYLLHSDTFAFLSIFSVRQELADGRLRLIELENGKMERTLTFVYRQGQPSPLARLFMRFAAVNAKDF